MIPLPNLNSPFTGRRGGVIPPWVQYLQQFTQAPPKMLAVTVGASPFSYQAKEPGFISVNAGTVSAITLTRGTDIIDVTGTKLIPVAINDTLTVTYSVLPTLKFLASYGQNTGNQ